MIAPGISLARLLQRTRYDAATGCWLWVGTLDKNGYGRIFGSYADQPRKVYFAHRAVVTAARGPIPNDLPLDHLCQVRNCVNPMHLEAVTAAENSRRMNALRIKDGRKDTCPNGHPYDIERDVPGKPWKHRRCSICHNARNRRSAARRKAADMSGMSRPGHHH